MSPNLESNLPPDDPEVVEAAAAAWLSLRDRGMSEAETAEFVRWLQENPRNAEVFAELDRTWKLFDRVSAIAPAGEVREADPELLAPRARGAKPRRRTWALVAGLAAVFVLAGLGVWPWEGGGRTVETAVGAFQRLDLPDGSVVQLNTDSVLRVRYSRAERRLELVRGEAYFDVAKQPARPFVVGVGPLSVRAVGTAFNVRKRAAAVEVLVTEGRVEVSEAAQGQPLLGESAGLAGPPYLREGERAVVTLSEGAQQHAKTTAAAAVDAAEVKRVLAWQERRLEFEGRPLAEVAEEFNRYNRIQLVLGDAALGRKRFSGTFRADGYESLVNLLQENFGVRVERREGEIVLRGE
jgi:Fe2+-dicitrate sensor, membrane component